jgi:predicted enzyme related to lactoylglutathione lyase
MIIGVHALLYAPDAEEARTFFRDVLGLSSVDAGGGWPIFALPPAEVAAHPTSGAASHELYLMCDDLDATMKELSAKGAEFGSEITEEQWGRVATIKVPGGGDLGLYQPYHPLAIEQIEQK